MPKMSYEGLVGVVIALIVVILDQAGIKNPYVLWVAFALACGLCLDATLRSGWNRRAKGWGSAAIVLSFAFFAAYLVHQLYSKPKRDEAKQGLQEDKKPNQGNPPSTEAPVVKPIPLAKPLKRQRAMAD